VKKAGLIYFIPIALMLFSDCKQLYTPNIKKSNLGYLVVDGTILNADSTIVLLSRTGNLTDSNYIPVPETGAQIDIVGNNGNTYSLSESGTGKYIGVNLNFDYTENYQLKITTSNSKIYLSDVFNLKKTPPIDSVSWYMDTASVIHFYVTTHDPQNNTRYYRWQYEETWEFRSHYQSNLIFKNGTLVKRSPDEQVWHCWTNNFSTDILVGTSIKLSNDEIYEQQLLTDSLYSVFYPVGHQLVLSGVQQRFSIEYSILVKQYGLTEDAYNYWILLKQNTEQLGSLFASQPGQVTGNIHCVTTPSEPVLGFVSASTVEQQRIFINPTQLYVGSATDPEIGCGTFLAKPPPSTDIYDYFSQTTLYTPIDSVFQPVTNKFLGVSGAFGYCADCTQSNGIPKKPAYWPN
jgi:hypothetical protein